MVIKRLFNLFCLLKNDECKGDFVVFCNIINIVLFFILWSNVFVFFYFVVDFWDYFFYRWKCGVYGLVIGKKVVVFVDDFNMLVKEKYGV